VVFFKTSEGLLHSGRIAGNFYIAGLLPGCHYFQAVDQLCVMRIVSTAGWWLSLCDQIQPRTFSDVARHLRRWLGLSPSWLTWPGSSTSLAARDS